MYNNLVRPIALALLMIGGDANFVRHAGASDHLQEQNKEKDKKDQIKLKLKDLVAALPGGVLLYAEMDGEQPVPNDLADHEGRGLAAFSMDIAVGQACVAVALDTVLYPDINHSHIHPSRRGQASPRTIIEWGHAIVRQLREDGSAVGCVFPGPDVIAMILADPSGFYFNVHTPANGIPDGGILRGQLSAEEPD
jgi:hypothetical protein